MRYVIGFAVSAFVGVYCARTYRHWVEIAQIQGRPRRAAALYALLSATLTIAMYFSSPGQSLGLWAIQTAILSLFLGVLIVDLDTMYIPDDLSFPLIALSIASRLYDFALPFSVSDTLSSIAPGAMAYLVFVAIEALHFKITGTDGLGRGDAKLIAAIAILLGPMLTLMVIAGASAFLIGQHLIYRLAGRDSDHLPFGPPLALIAVTVWIFGAGPVLAFLNNSPPTIGVM